MFSSRVALAITLPAAFVLALAVSSCQPTGAGQRPAVEPTGTTDVHAADEERDRARDLLEEGRTEEARESLALADSLAPGDEETLALRARVEADTGNLEEGISILERARPLHPDSEEIQLALHDLLVEGARTDLDEENYTRAWARLQEAGMLGPDTPEISYLRGTVAYAVAHSGPPEDAPPYLEESIRAFDSVLESDPDDDDARFNLGAALLAAGRAAEAADAYGQLIERHPDDGRLYLALSRAHSMEGNMEAAVVDEAIGRALRTDRPVEDPALWVSRAVERFPDSDLSRTYLDHGVPRAIYTYTLPGGGLVEVWFYGKGALVVPFRDGAYLGEPYRAGLTDQDEPD